MATRKRSSKRFVRARAVQPRRRSVAPRPQPAAANRRLRAPTLPIDPRFVEGIQLFNSRQFFACHEVLEQLWLKTEGRARDFYKGLIQAAVAFYHWSRNNSGGAISLYHSSSRYLRMYRPEYSGVDVEQFLRQYTALFTSLRRHPKPYDERLVPTIYWKDM